MTALFVSTSIISSSTKTSSPGFTLMSTIVASAIDSPSCGIMIGTCGIKLFFEHCSRFGSDHFRTRPMRAPKVWMIWNRRVFRVDAHRRGVEKVKSFARYARNHLRGCATPGKRFADGEQTSGPCNRRQHGVGIERFHRSKIDNFDFKVLARELFGDGERIVNQRA